MLKKLTNQEQRRPAMTIGNDGRSCDDICYYRCHYIQGTTLYWKNYQAGYLIAQM